MSVRTGRAKRRKRVRWYCGCGWNGLRGPTFAACPACGGKPECGVEGS